MGDLDLIRSIPGLIRFFFFDNGLIVLSVYLLCLYIVTLAGLETAFVNHDYFIIQLE